MVYPDFTKLHRKDSRVNNLLFYNNLSQYNNYSCGTSNEFFNELMINLCWKNCFEKEIDNSFKEIIVILDLHCISEFDIVFIIMTTNIIIVRHILGIIDGIIFISL